MKIAAYYILRKLINGILRHMLELLTSMLKKNGNLTVHQTFGL